MPAGRPSKKFDMHQVKLLGQFRATFKTMADWFECSEQTISRQMNKDSEFSKVYKRALANTKMKLYEAQVKYALAGNSSLLIWLGKNMLEQTDQQNQDNDKNQINEITFL